jgi:hypothetical protein
VLRVRDPPIYGLVLVRLIDTVPIAMKEIAMKEIAMKEIE